MLRTATAGMCVCLHSQEVNGHCVTQQEEVSPPYDSKLAKAEVAEPAAAAAGVGASTSSEGDSHSEDGGGAAVVAGGSASAGAGGGKPKRQRKIPKLPMVRHGKKWYRARLLKEAAARVLLGAPGC